MLTSITFAALAALGASTAAAQEAAPVPGVVAPEVVPEGDTCAVRLSRSEYESNSIQDILEGAYEKAFGENQLAIAPLIALVDSSTLDILEGFDDTSEGYTAIVPMPTVANTSAPPEEQAVPLFEYYGLDITNITEAEASAMLAAHVLPGTLRYPDIEQALVASANGTYSVESLQGFEWTFKWETRAANESEGYIVVVNPHEPETSVTLVQSDLSNADLPCPNVVHVVNSILITPDLLELDEETMAADPPSTAVPPTAGTDPTLTPPGIDSRGGIGEEEAGAPAEAAGAGGSIAGSLLAGALLALGAVYV